MSGGSVRDFAFTAEAVGSYVQEIPLEYRVQVDRIKRNEYSKPILESLRPGALALRRRSHGVSQHVSKQQQLEECSDKGVRLWVAGSTSNTLEDYAISRVLDVSREHGRGMSIKLKGESDGVFDTIRVSFPPDVASKKRVEQFFKFLGSVRRGACPQRKVLETARRLLLKQLGVTQDGAKPAKHKAPMVGSGTARQTPRREPRAMLLMRPNKARSASRRNPFQSFRRKRGKGSFTAPRKPHGIVAAVPMRVYGEDRAAAVPTGSGFKNLGNTCYLNAVLTTMIHLPPFVRSLCCDQWLEAARSGQHRRAAAERNTPAATQTTSCGKTAVYRALVDVIQHKFSKDRATGTASFKDAVGRHSAMFSGNEQQDAHEFLVDSLSQIHEELAPLARSVLEGSSSSASADVSSAAPAVEQAETPVSSVAAASSTSVDTVAAGSGTSSAEVSPESSFAIASTLPTVQAFHMRVATRLTCAKCKYSRRRVEDTHHLSVDARPPHSESTSHNLQHLLACHFKTSELEYRCRRCSCTKVVATPQISGLPRVLIVHLKRFLPNVESSTYDKVCDEVRFPARLSLARWCAPQVGLPPTSTVRESVSTLRQWEKEGAALRERRVRAEQIAVATPKPAKRTLAARSTLSAKLVAGRTSTRDSDDDFFPARQTPKDARRVRETAIRSSEERRSGAPENRWGGEVSRRSNNLVREARAMPWTDERMKNIDMDEERQLREAMKRSLEDHTDALATPAKRSRSEKQWACLVCTFVNEADVRHCQICQHERTFDAVSKGGLYQDAADLDCSPRGSLPCVDVDLTSGVPNTAHSELPRQSHDVVSEQSDDESVSVPGTALAVGHDADRTTARTLEEPAEETDNAHPRGDADDSDSSADESDSDGDAARVDASLPRYKLQAVIQHHGKFPFAGHYTANVLGNARSEDNPGGGGDGMQQWYNHNDSKISRVAEADVTNRSGRRRAYILFYVLDHSTTTVRSIRNASAGTP